MLKITSTADKKKTGTSQMGKTPEFFAAPVRLHGKITGFISFSFGEREGKIDRDKEEGRRLVWRMSRGEKTKLTDVGATTISERPASRSFNKSQFPPLPLRLPPLGRLITRQSNKAQGNINTDLTIVWRI